MSLLFTRPLSTAGIRAEPELNVASLADWTDDRERMARARAERAGPSRS